jgi:hypothetical protein
MTKHAFKSPEKIWQVPMYLPYLQPALTDEAINDAELKIGHKLPLEYISLLRIQNGGYIRYTLSDTPHEVIAGIGSYFPSLTEFNWLNEYEGAVSFELNGLIPFDGDGHWNICLDYRKNKTEPEITYIDTETDYEIKIADSFRDYLALLVLKTDCEYVIQSNRSLNEAIKNISALTGITFEEPDTFAQGYPIYRSKINEAWIWVSPNKVPKGFVRPTEDRYEELKHWMEQSSLRYSELSENDLLINCSEEVEMKKLFAILLDKGVRIIKLSSLLGKSPNR